VTFHVPAVYVAGGTVPPGQATASIAAPSKSPLTFEYSSGNVSCAEPSALVNGHASAEKKAFVAAGYH
jgi:hypothetical protein